MVVAGAQARLRRFQVKGNQILWGSGALVLVLMLALVTPFLAWWGRSLATELTTAKFERDQLAARSEQVERTLAELRTRMNEFEEQTATLGRIAGIEVVGAPPAAGPAANIAELAPVAKADLLRSEADELIERSQLLERRLATVGRAVVAHAERLAHIPSILPAPGLVGSGFGWRRDPFTGSRQFHKGIDIEAPHGSPIYAPADAIVIKSERDAGYGNVLFLSHGNGLVTRFGHLSGFEVVAGQKVHRGDLIGRVGATGRATAAHLHYEVLRHGDHVDPMRFIGTDALFR
jgi:murein DD-endopeptidase MepM/ murein hydrolase activator NlpD